MAVGDGSSGQSHPGRIRRKWSVDPKCGLKVVLVAPVGCTYWFLDSADRI